MGGLTSLTSRGRTTPPPRPRPGSGKAAPQGDTEPPPPPRKAPHTGTPGQRPEPAAGRGQRGAVHEWGEQQHQLHRAGAWEARAVSAEAANRDLEGRLSRANEDRRAAESRLADVTKERDRLVTRVKTLERDLGTARMAAGAPAKPPAQTGEGVEGAEGPSGERARGGGDAAGVRYLMAGAQACHAHAEACAGQMSVVSTGLRMAMMTTGQQADVDTVAPDALMVSAAMKDVRRQYTPHRLTQAAMDPSFAEAVVEQTSQGSASRSSVQGGGGGGVAHPLTSGPPVPSNLHGCYLYIFIYEYMYKYPPPPPQGMGSLTDMWGTPPPLCGIFFISVCILVGVSCAP